MDRTEILAAMSELKLYGMKAAFDEIIATAVKRQHEPQRIIGDLLSAEITEKQARSIRYQITIAKLPLAKDLAAKVWRQEDHATLLSVEGSTSCSACSSNGRKPSSRACSCRVKTPQMCRLKTPQFA